MDPSTCWGRPPPTCVTLSDSLPPVSWFLHYCPPVCKAIEHQVAFIVLVITLSENSLLILFSSPLMKGDRRNLAICVEDTSGGAEGDHMGQGTGEQPYTTHLVPRQGRWGGGISAVLFLIRVPQLLHKMHTSRRFLFFIFLMLCQTFIWAG